MRYKQAKQFVGYVTIHIKGKHPELFFQHCVENDMIVMDVKKLSSTVCAGTIYIHELKQVKWFIKRMPYELVHVQSPRGLRPLVTNMWSHKEMILSIFLCLSLLFFLSHIAWKMEINGVSEETDRQIREVLEKEGLYEGAWIGNLQDVNIIQQKVLHTLPDLMYIGIHKNGTAYHIDAIEKKQEQPKENMSPRNLVAAKDGEIASIFVKQGISKVAVHDIVKKGDLLVSGLTEEEKEKDEKTDGPVKEAKKLAAEGEIYANTWYEMDVTSAIETDEHKLSGETYQRFYITFFDHEFPIWGFKQPFSNAIKEEKTNALHLFKAVFPVKFKIDTYYETEQQIHSRDKEQLRKNAIQHIEHTLKRKSGKDAKILYYKILHEQADSGKVKINLYVSVLEDIGRPQEIR